MNKEIKEILSFKEDTDYKRLSIEDILLIKECIAKQEECYCNRTDCSGRIRDSKKYDSLQQRIDKAIEYVKSKKAIINTDYIRMFDLFKIDEQGYTDKLLEILQGSDKE